MLRRRIASPRAIAAILPLALALALAGCGKKADTKVDTDTATISFGDLGNAEAGGNGGDGAQSVSLQTPGFAAKLNLPGLVLGSGSMNLDGIPFHPGTKIAGLKISGAAGDGSGGEGHGAVEAGFTDPAPAEQLLAYYRDAARRGGWSETPPAAGQQFAATKNGHDGTKTLAIQIGAGAGGGSAGRFLVTGS